MKSKTTFNGLKKHLRLTALGIGFTAALTSHAAAPLTDKDLNLPFAPEKFSASMESIALGWPVENIFVIQSLAKTGDAIQNQIKRVELLGYRGKLKFTQTTEGLTVELPGKK